MWLSPGSTGSPRSSSRAFREGGIQLLGRALGGARLEVTHAGKRPGGQHRGERGGEDETGRMRAYGIDAHGRGGDVAAHHECLGERSLDHIDLLGNSVAFGNAAAPRPIHADGMDLVEIGKGVLAACERADRGDRGDVAVHGIDLEGDDLVHPGGTDQLRLEIVEIIVPPDELGATACLMPSIIEAWLSSSERMMQRGGGRPKVERVATLAR